MATRFERHVQKQVQDFLQTVLMIDDEAFRRVPATLDAGDEVWLEEQPIGQLLKLQPPTESLVGDELDVQEVSLGFANKGLSCAILSPQTTEENDEFKPAFVKTAKRADALILDWNLNGDGGKTVEKLIRSVLKEDVRSPKRRLRLITIYTGEPDLEKIAERVLNVTEECLGQDVVNWDDDGKVAFSRGPVRVAVFAKEHVRNLSTALQGRRRNISALPGLVVEEFSRHSMGLVTSASLSALAGIRNDSHRLLAALSPELDAAILGQRMALNHPEDVERQVETLIGSELLAIVQDHEVGAQVGIVRIKEWLGHHKHIGPRGLSSFEAITANMRLDFLSEGLGDDVIDQRVTSELSKAKLKKIRDEGAGLFSVDSSARDSSNRILAARMSMRSRYSKPSPVLQLGSIIEQSGKYAVCVQPLCDSVRIDTSRAFPLLPLEIAEERDGKPGDGLLTVRDERRPGAFVRLRVTATPAKILMQEFEASSSGVVKAQLKRRVYRFPTPSRKSWRWVGELKPDHAQRVVEKLSSNFSRVGLDEAEVLRLGL